MQIINIDGTGYKCPMPVLFLKKKLKELGLIDDNLKSVKEKWENIEVIYTFSDPISSEDVEKLCKNAGLSFKNIGQNSSELKLRIIL